MYIECGGSAFKNSGILARLAILFLAAAWSGAALGGVIFVSLNGDDTHNGQSWDTAKRTVTAGLNAAANGDQVWVAAGTYVERITLKLDVALYGGLEGVEDPATFNLVTRDFAAHETALDGDHAGSVVIGPVGATETCRIDGFTIENGSATFGGGIYLVSSSPTIANNTIAGNSAYDGGALYGESAAPTIADNTITGNIADGYGGGLYLESSSPTIVNNWITGNTAHHGGGLVLFAGSLGTIADNAIRNNSAQDSGGGLVLVHSSPTVVDNTLSDNSACCYGGGAYLYDSSPTIAYNTIGGNTAYEGGGMFLVRSSPAITDNTITYNTATSGCSPGNGGGLYVYGASPAINGNSISGNLAGDGAGLYLDDSSSTIADNTVADNCGAGYGGGVFACDSFLAITNNMILRNSSGEPGQGRDGGGIYVEARFEEGLAVTIAGNTISGNSCRGFGGGIEVVGSDATIVNNTITENSAHDSGGGADLAGGATNVANNTIAGNVAGANGGGLNFVWGATMIEYNRIIGNRAENGGGLVFYGADTVAISNNEIAGNAGDGLSIDANFAVLTNNTIVGNTGYYRGGLSIRQYTNAVVTDTILAFNSYGILSAGNTVLLRNNCVYGSSAYNYYGLLDPTGTDGNISVDPLFVDWEHGDFRVVATSPCVDAGNNADAIGAYDLGGQPRIVDGNGDGAAVVDMGAHEYQVGAPRCPGDADCDGQVGFGDIDLFVAAIPDNPADWAALYAARHGGAQPTCAFLNCDCTGDGQVLFDDIDAFVALIPASCP